MRTCPKCKAKYNTTSSKCRPCHNTYMKAWYKAKGYKPQLRNRDAIRAFVKKEKEKPCMDCRQTYHWFAMDFDHVRGKKTYNLSICAQKGLSLGRVKQEIEKCDLVCANCHRFRTFVRNKMKYEDFIPA